MSKIRFLIDNLSRLLVVLHIPIMSRVKSPRNFHTPHVMYTTYSSQDV